ncbi:MAG: sugar phosphate isomerase/epimerase [Gemmatimonadetes bacterium]|nr:sugar phosphate isomerase/epimerase [Gemmatimonadota bacterium]
MNRQIDVPERGGLGRRGRGRPGPGTYRGQLRAAMLIGYNTNGFAHHALDDAMEILAELGYDAISITPDVHHLPPFATSARELRRLRGRLEGLGLTPVIETGARYVLDARRKHRPNLLEPDAAGRAARAELLRRCAEIAAEIGAGVISIWSGQKPEATPPEDADRFLAEGVAGLCDAAAALGVRVAFEPEPGMWVESLAQWERLRDHVAHPSLGLTLDTGHVPCTEAISPAAAIRRHGSELLNVHLDDGRNGVHDHLQIGEGELAWGEILIALRDFEGVAAVELSRHSHDAPRAAAAALSALRRAG